MDFVRYDKQCFPVCVLLQLGSPSKRSGLGGLTDEDILRCLKGGRG